VILLHETELAALSLPALIAALRKDGWQIITADEAYAGPLARAAPDRRAAQATRIEAMAWEKGLPAPRWYERENVKIANALFAQRVPQETPAKANDKR
jgi:peptidoglycan-N-acetylglucosamine deacetylase